MNDCLFCKIIAGQIPSNKVYEDEYTYAFHDIAPQAKVHVLVVSKKHTPDLAHNADLSDQEQAACLRTCAKVAEMTGLTEAQAFGVSTSFGGGMCVGSVCGAVTGALLGAQLGVDNIPDFYLDCLEAEPILRQLAQDVGQGSTTGRGSGLFDDEWDRKYVQWGR